MNKGGKSSSKMSRSEIRIIEFNSKSLQGNPLGDPSVRSLPVYLPPGYVEGQQRYPVVFLLAAFAYRAKKLLNDSLWEENIQERMDRLIQEQKVRPMILALPDATTRYGGSQYINSSATGNYEDYIIELTRIVDEQFHTTADRDHRAVLGHSSGGYGALTMGMRHADTFGLAADHSGDKYFELVFRPDFGIFLRFIEKSGIEGVKNLLADPGGELRRGAPFGALNIAAMSSCFSPNPDGPFGFDLPFDPVSGKLDGKVWRRWKKWDPLEMLDTYKDNLRSLRLLYFDCGRWDEHNLLYGARQFRDELDKLKIVYEYEEYDGGHRKVAYRYDTSLQAISRAME